MSNINSTKPVIAVDVDDVLAINAPAFIEYSNQKFGTNLTVDDYHDNWVKMWKIDIKEVEKRAIDYHQAGHHATYEPMGGAMEALRELKKKFRLVILTTRPTSINQLTRDWIGKHYPNIFEDFYFTGFFDQLNNLTKHNWKKTKGELVRSINADYLIDDQPKHIESAAKVGISSLLFGDYPWNKGETLPTNVTRVKNWQEVLDYFKNVNQ